MQHRFFGVLFILFTIGCASHRTQIASSEAVMRRPASLFDYEGAADEQTQKDLREVTAALTSANRTTFENTKKIIKKRMDQILKRSAAAAALMNDFDRQLDSYLDDNGSPKPGVAFDLHSMATYKKLQTARDLIEAVEWRLSTVYAHLWKLSIDPSQMGISGSRVERTKNNANQLLDYIHNEVEAASNDVRAIGLIRVQHHLEDIAGSLAEDGQKPNVRFAQLEQIVANIQRNEDRLTSYNDFIEAMKNVKDQEFEQQIKAVERNPNNNILVAGFRNTTGSEFSANTWVLTFDDGPSTAQTLKIAGILKQYGAGGDFFWLSNLAKNQPGIVKSVYDSGFGVASHSINHANLTKLSGDSLRQQVSGSRDVITQTLKDQGATNYRMKDFRCPYGACWAPKSQKVQQAIVDAGLRHVYWTVDTLDWQDKNTQSVLSRTLKQMKAAGRGIILFHDIHPVAGNVLPLLFQDKYVQDNKLKFLSL